METDAWEYLVEEMILDCSAGIGISKPKNLNAEIMEKLNALGQNGWEMIGIQLSQLVSNSVGRYYFKRRKKVD